jgi:hypothetical protein
MTFEQWVRLNVVRCDRTGTNTYANLPLRTLDPLVNVPRNEGLSTYSLLGPDGAGEQVVATGRFVNQVKGKGLDITDYPSGLQRTVELDWREGIGSVLDMVIDAQGNARVLLLIGEWQRGGGRLVVRRQSGNTWVESAPVLSVAVNGADIRVSRLRVGPDGRDRVLTLGKLVAADPLAVILATADATGQWVRERVSGNATNSMPELDFAIDGSGAVHAVVVSEQSSYPYTTTNYSLSYVYKSGSTWTTETIAPNVSTRPPRAVAALDTAGQPTVAYVLGSGADLGFSRRSAGVWQNATLTGGSAMGFAMANDASGRPCIAHGSGSQPVLDCLQNNGFVSSSLGQVDVVYILGMGRDASGALHLIGRRSATPYGTDDAHLVQGASSWTVSDTFEHFSNSPVVAVTPSGAAWLATREVDRILVRHR